MATFACHNCDGTGYVYSGEGSTLDEDNYDICSHCGGYGFFEEEDEEMNYDLYKRTLQFLLEHESDGGNVSPAEIIAYVFNVDIRKVIDDLNILSVV